MTEKTGDAEGMAFVALIIGIFVGFALGMLIGSRSISIETIGFSTMNMVMDEYSNAQLGSACIANGRDWNEYLEKCETQEGK